MSANWHRDPPNAPFRGRRESPGDLSSSSPRRTYGDLSILLAGLSFVTFWMPLLAWVPAVGGIVAGAKGLSKSHRGDSNKAKARVGLVLSLAALATMIVLIALALSRIQRLENYW